MRYKKIVKEGSDRVVVEAFRAMLQGKITNKLVTVFPRKKYINIDVGGSGKFMYDKDDSCLYFIKGYGVINRKKNFGKLFDIVKADFDWDGYSIIKKDSGKTSAYGFAGKIV